MKYYFEGMWVNDDTVKELPPGATSLSDTEWANRPGYPYKPTDLLSLQEDGKKYPHYLAKPDASGVLQPDLAKCLIDQKTAKKEDAQTEKNRIRDGGFDVGGKLFDSDNAAQTMYLSLDKQFKDHPTLEIKDYKASAGCWVTMNAALLADVASALALHYSVCFSWLRAKEKEIDDCTTEEELNPITLIFGE
ncbi:MAG: DUF4376 domain-containing protein [Desulfotalea sp.]